MKPILILSACKISKLKTPSGMVKIRGTVLHISSYFQARGTIYVSICNFLLWLFAYMTYMRNPESDLPNFYCEFIMVLGFFGLLVIFVGYGLMSKRFRHGLRGKNAAMAAKYKVVKGGKISEGIFKLMIWIVSKGQLISKTMYGLLTSPKKRICFVYFFTLHGKQIKFVCSFFGRLYGLPICFLSLSDP